MKKSSISFFLYFLCLLFFASGCVATSGITTVHATKAQGATFANKKTYAWYQEEPVASQDMESGFTEVLNRHMKRAVEEVLQEKGFRKVDANPDLLVAYDVSVSVPIEKDNPAYYAPGFGYSYAYEAGYRYKYSTSKIEGLRPIDLFKQGTLIIDIIDPATSQLIWRGWSEGAFNDFNARYKKVKGEVEPILNNMPVK